MGPYSLDLHYERVSLQSNSRLLELTITFSAYAITSMCVSIVIAGAFQLLLFRTPARRKLRLDVAAVTFGLSSYNTLLQSYVSLFPPMSCSAR